MDKIMFKFEWPIFLVLLILPFLVRILMREKTTLEQAEFPGVRFPHLAHLRAAFGGSSDVSRSRGKVVPILLSVVWTLLVFALMRPEFINQLTEVKNEGHDLMLAVDLSGSMQSLDFSEGNEQISRLDVAKKVVKEFVEKRSGDRIGLVLFGEHAYLQAPLTLDTSAVTKMLDNSLSGMAGDATAIGDAIGLSVKNLRERPAGSRAIVLLTDGDDNSSTIPPLEAARLAKQYGIHIYTVVIGKEGVVPFPDGHGGIQMVESQVDTSLTQKIAEITGGAFYRATDRAGLEKIYDQIDTLEKSKSESQSIFIREPLYEYPLGVALLLFFMMGLIVQKKRLVYEF
jgi:Ca-activated chloride channel family protein